MKKKYIQTTQEIIEAEQVDLRQEPWPDNVHPWPEEHGISEEMPPAYCGAFEDHQWVCTGDYIVTDSHGKTNDLEALQFVSNVIELKPDRKYLLVFNGLSMHQLNVVQDALRSHGFDCLCLNLPKGDDLQVIETSEAVESKSFWEQISQSMTINERRAIFKEIAEHLGISNGYAKE
jgi:hypothetical protein